jgi:hypothetical protein
MRWSWFESRMVLKTPASSDLGQSRRWSPCAACSIRGQQPPSGCQVTCWPCLHVVYCLPCAKNSRRICILCHADIEMWYSC